MLVIYETRHSLINIKLRKLFKKIPTFPFNPSPFNPGQREKINLNFYFHLKGLHKTF